MLKHLLLVSLLFPWTCLVSGQSISGMKNRHLTIRYYGYDLSPVNLNKPGTRPLERQSEVYFLEDECIIRKDGSGSGGSIVFSPGLNSKRIGASLPNDYEPTSF